MDRVFLNLSEYFEHQNSIHSNVFKMNVFTVQVLQTLNERFVFELESSHLLYRSKEYDTIVEAKKQLKNCTDEIRLAIK